MKALLNFDAHEAQPLVRGDDAEPADPHEGVRDEVALAPPAPGEAVVEQAHGQPP
jgi:hypothetical protein